MNLRLLPVTGSKSNAGPSSQRYPPFTQIRVPPPPQIPSLVVPPAFTVMSTSYLLFIPAALLFGSTASYTIDKVESANFLFPVAIYAAMIPYLVVSIVDMIGVSAVGCTRNSGCCDPVY